MYSTLLASAICWTGWPDAAGAQKLENGNDDHDVRVFGQLEKAFLSYGALNDLAVAQLVFKMQGAIWPPREGSLPLSIIGGFLGTGKTTLLNRLLVAPHGRRRRGARLRRSRIR